MQAVLEDNMYEAYEGLQALLVEVVRRCPPDVLPYALQCLLELRLEAVQGASLQLSQQPHPHGLVITSQGADLLEHHFRVHTQHAHRTCQATQFMRYHAVLPIVH